ncbi:MAG: class I SAM-dependent methyltransferase [Gaiellaceae bacterium MAG52_C11]|nr:class I SAM-dependent methyltransferase [Candidatus Gaiellasilicea maunaloa]
MSTGWEDRAEGLIAWARKPGHDAYWLYRDSFFELVPPPGRRTLEIGCGEGRVSRDLRDRGHAVTGLDAAPTLVAAAADADPASEYVVSVAESLPFEDGSFDLVVAYNSLMDVEDMPAAVGEAARVLESGGRFCVCVTHPFRDAGRFETRENGAPFVVTGSYFEEGTYEFTAERDGLTFTWASRTYPLASYMRALEEASLLVEALREPVGFDDRDRRMPQFLHLRAVKQ